MHTDQADYIKKNKRYLHWVDVPLVAHSAQFVSVSICIIPFSFLYHRRMIGTSVVWYVTSQSGGLLHYIGI